MKTIEQADREAKEAAAKAKAVRTGGPAFPVAGYLGLTIRDYFAAKAMEAAATSPVGASGFTFRRRAEWAYMQADAMLAARG